MDDPDDIAPVGLLASSARSKGEIGDYLWNALNRDWLSSAAPTTPAFLCIKHWVKTISADSQPLPRRWRPHECFVDLASHE